MRALLLIPIVLILWALIFLALHVTDEDEPRAVVAREVIHKFPSPTTTTTTTVAPRARTAPTVRTANVSKPVGEIQDAIRRGFARFGPAVAEQAIRVAGRESTGDRTGGRLNPQARNGGHWGLFQIAWRWHSARAQRLGFTQAQLLEVDPNVAVAADIFAEEGWRPWTCRWAA